MSNLSNWGWANQHVARLDLQRDNAVNDMIDGLLIGERYNPTAVKWLAGRERISSALKRLAAVARTRRKGMQSNLLPILLERQVPPKLRLFRLCVEFGAVTLRSDRVQVLPTRGALKRRPAGRVALAASGECRWSRANTRERAAYALARLIREHSQ